MKHSLHRTLLAALLAAGAIAPTAQAAAPMVKSQAPGFYRIMLGDFEVTPLNDGTVDLPMDQLLKQNADTTRATLGKNFLKVPTETSDNAFLINTGSKLVLVDTGAGTLFGPTLGKLVLNLKAAGYQPEQVDEIYITHMHPDHVGGLSSNGKPVFANALVRAGKADADFWLSQANLDKAPADKKGTFQGAMASLTPTSRPASSRRSKRMASWSRASRRSPHPATRRATPSTSCRAAARSWCWSAT
jgi:hypothetical protein